MNVKENKMCVVKILKPVKKQKLQVSASLLSPSSPSIDHLACDGRSLVSHWASSPCLSTTDRLSVSRRLIDSPSPPPFAERSEDSEKLGGWDQHHSFAGHHQRPRLQDQ